MNSSPFLFVILLVVCIAALSSAQPYFSLHRIARAHPADAALLVPFPRVGKRADAPEPLMDSATEEASPEEALAELHKRLFVARVGKRFMYAARVGK